MLFDELVSAELEPVLMPEVECLLKMKRKALKSRDSVHKSDLGKSRSPFLVLKKVCYNIHKENDEVLLASEVDELEEKLSKLLDNKLTEIEEMVCIEPDFIFKLYPQTDLREDPKYTYIQPGYEIQDIYLEWKIFFWHGGLTDNYLTITLDRNEIESLRDYLAAIIKQ